MSSGERLVHIDGLRGLAVLLMVMVHAAATWAPSSPSDATMLSLLVSGLGGLAAPLFVTLLGWGLIQRPRTWQERWRQATFLFACQFAVNLSAPHLFEPFTPGILSLMGLLVLTQPWWGRQWTPRPLYNMGILCVQLMFLLLLLDPFQTPSDWGARVSTPSLAVAGWHLLLTGTYPLIPWAFFAAFGAMISCYQRPEVAHDVLLRLSLIGLVISFATLVYSVRAEVVWALPTGDAVLTFFPANIPFLIAACTGVALLWILASTTRAVDRFSELGRTSLSVYVVHFVPFVWLYQLDETYAWSASMSALTTLAYTLVWAIIGTLWYRHVRGWSLETLLRSWMKRPSDLPQPSNSEAE